MGSARASSDAQIYESELKEMAEDGPIGFLAPNSLPNDYKDVPYVFVTYDAFGLRKHIMKPYTSRDLTDEKRIFNKQPGGLLNMSLAFWQTASRFCLPQFSTTHPPSRSS